jgi:hypothetical protein
MAVYHYPCIDYRRLLYKEEIVLCIFTRKDYTINLQFESLELWKYLSFFPLYGLWFSSVLEQMGNSLLCKEGYRSSKKKSNKRKPELLFFC